MLEVGFVEDQRGAPIDARAFGITLEIPLRAQKFYSSGAQAFRSSCCRINVRISSAVF